MRVIVASPQKVGKIGGPLGVIGEQVPKVHRHAVMVYSLRRVRHTDGWAPLPLPLSFVDTTMLTPSSVFNDVYIIEPRLYEDERGFFMETFRQEWLNTKQYSLIRKKIAAYLSALKK